jgi:hypothetical protein
MVVPCSLGAEPASRYHSSAPAGLVLVCLILLAPAPVRAFSAPAYEALANLLRANGADVGRARPRHVDGELVLPKRFRTALARYLGDSFRGNQIVVTSDGRVTVGTSAPEAHRYTINFDCRQPGFQILWRPAASSEDHGVVGIETEARECVSDGGAATGSALWHVPEGHDKAAAEAIGMLREMYVGKR